MTVAIPVAVKALQSGNKDLIRNTSSYLSLAAIHNGRLLAQYSLQIINSITTGQFINVDSNCLSCPFQQGDFEKISLFDTDIELYKVLFRRPYPSLWQDADSINLYWSRNFKKCYQICINISGNYSLVRVLQQVYPENKEPFHAHLAPLLAILQHSECDPSEKLSILQLAAMVANYKPEVSQESLIVFCNLERLFV